ncbi:MAG: hypothetical protein BGO12_14860 [Verrucomicrobia bacterium 61-8]|nr:hypothetical protein [Verrucomicrobiota bacterium]OJV02211.1 MAG: hypothetical protein BGO12_14860 [Verrucomicrobia bacterium 61-8]
MVRDIPISIRAFSLVEVAIAVGILAFVIISVVGLLGVGLKSNQVSVEETRAAAMLTMLEADLRNTHSSLNGGKSSLFGLPLPYRSAPGGVTFDPAILAGSFFTTGVNDMEMPVSLAAGRPRFQASVSYLEAPGASGVKPMVARLVVNWPATNTSSAADVSNPAKVRGSVEALVSFPAP